jgi:poly(3-hydroxybutyrate) depolymerase
VTRNRANCLATLAALAGLIAASAQAAEPLPSFVVDIDRTSVSGVSSGAYMAGQFHVAFSDRVTGAGLIAGGPYFCAEGLVSTALSQCMKTTLGEPDSVRLFGLAQDFANQGRTDELANLADDRVYIFSGTRDETVLTAVADTATAFYRLAGVPDGRIAAVTDLPAGHAMVTDDHGGACATTESPFINDCDYDQAGAILEHIYGTLNPPSASPSGSFVEFEQGEFIGDPPRHSMNDVGYVYVPQACSDGATCKVHIVFHGCRQTTDHIGDRFYRHAGYNEWADSNGIIVLYPQAWAGPGNPRGCWDWWGYDSADYHLKTGRQMAAVMAMLRRLAGEAPDGPTCRVHDATAFGHWQAGRVYLCGFGFTCAAGSDEDLGLLFPFSPLTLFEQPEGTFSSTACGE